MDSIFESWVTDSSHAVCTVLLTSNRMAYPFLQAMQESAASRALHIVDILENVLSLVALDLRSYRQIYRETKTTTTLLSCRAVNRQWKAIFDNQLIAALVTERGALYLYDWSAALHKIAISGSWTCRSVTYLAFGDRCQAPNNWWVFEGRLLSACSAGARLKELVFHDDT